MNLPYVSERTEISREGSSAESNVPMLPLRSEESAGDHNLSAYPPRVPPTTTYQPFRHNVKPWSDSQSGPLGLSYSCHSCPVYCNEFAEDFRRRMILVGSLPPMFKNLDAGSKVTMKVERLRRADVWESKTRCDLRDAVEYIQRLSRLQIGLCAQRWQLTL
jgi:hypothetical protein